MRELSRYLQSRLIVFLTILACSISHAARAEEESLGPIHVLVDVSKDGGLWWFPQAHTFNSNAYHQGKPLADLMRAKGWKVTELPRGELITYDTLRGADVVIRPPAFFRYRREEVSAYQQSVFAGTTLILLGGGRSDLDAVADGFGLRFESFNQFGSVKQWMPHPLTVNFQCCELPWTPVSDVPPSAIELAWLKPSEPNRLPILGYLPYGSGYVVFVGNALTHRLLFDGLVSAVVSNNLAELPLGQPIMAQQSLESPPQLLEPIADATLPQPHAAEWRFDWEDIPGARSYEIVILGRSAAFPLVQTTTSKSEYTFPVSGGYIAAHNLLGWSWRVRAQYMNGSWGPWSNMRRFNVTP